MVKFRYIEEFIKSLLKEYSSAISTLIYEKQLPYTASVTTKEGLTTSYLIGQIYYNIYIPTLIIVLKWRNSLITKSYFIAFINVRLRHAISVVPTRFKPSR